MLSQHKRISEQRASAGGIRLTAQETQRADEWETTLAVRSIWNIARMRTRPLLSGSINDLNFLKVSSSHAGGLLRSAHFADGLFLLAYTKGFLEDREHRLVLRAEGGVEYFRRPVNVDCQRIESRPVHVTTIQEIASDPHFFIIHSHFGRSS